MNNISVFRAFYVFSQVFQALNCHNCLKDSQKDPKNCLYIDSMLFYLIFRERVGDSMIFKTVQRGISTELFEFFPCISNFKMSELFEDSEKDPKNYFYIDKMHFYLTFMGKYVILTDFFKFFSGISNFKISEYCLKNSKKILLKLFLL